MRPMQEPSPRSMYSDAAGDVGAEPPGALIRGRGESGALAALLYLLVAG